jgi:ribonuclease HI
MSKNKFYAVKIKNKSWIKSSWEETIPLIKGVKGVLHKSFKTKEEAEAWIKGISPKEDDGLFVYVDGSFFEDFNYAGWAFVVVFNGKEMHRDSGITEIPAKSRNIDGELTASIKALEWLNSNDKTGVICHDYLGVAHFATGEWKAKTPISIDYIRKSRPILKRNIFKKVDAHTGHKWNDLVDLLAKEAIEKAKKNPPPPVEVLKEGQLNLFDV